MKQVLTAISGSQENLVALRTNKSRSQVVEELNKIAGAISSAVEDLRKNSPRSYSDAKKVLRSCCNTVEGISNGLSTRELDRKTALSLMGSVAVSLQKVPDLLADADKRKQERQIAESDSDISHEISDNEPAAQNALSSETESLEKAQKAIKKASTVSGPVSDGNNSEISSALRKAEESINNLPHRSNLAYQVARMPLVPIFDKAIHLNSSEQYRKLGFNAIMIEGYPIIFDQMVLAISKKKAAEYKMTALEFAKEAVDAINESSSVKISLVSDVPQMNPRNSDLYLYWVFPTNKWTALLRAAGSSIGTVRWGLPFSA